MRREETIRREMERLAIVENTGQYSDDRKLAVHLQRFGRYALGPYLAPSACAGVFDEDFRDVWGKVGLIERRETERRGAKDASDGN